jgi:MinD-like ATPase involved in chromosome partitioning or flagellar assembly
MTHLASACAKDGSAVHTSVITLRHPKGSVKLNVPTDIPIDELMPDFLDVTQQPDSDGWLLARAGGPPYPVDKTLADLGVDEDMVLVLHEPTGAPAPAPPPVQPAQTLEAPLLPRDGVAPDRPVSARSARTLPEQLSSLARARIALRALGTRTPMRPDAADRAVGSVPDPATFTLPARVSPFARVRAAWAHTEYERRLEQMILALRLRRCVTIAVVSPKGGVGKSTTTALLGSLLAFLRRDRVVAVDTNPDWGSLGRRLVPDHPIFIDDLLAGPLREGQLSATHLDAQLGRGPDGLMVAPAPTDPDRACALDEAAYRTLFARLGDLVGTLVLDCGTGLGSPAARAALGCADQLVLVADGEPDTASLVAEAAEKLEQHAPPLVLVVNKLDRSSRVDVGALEREVDFARGIVRVPTNRTGADQLHASRFSWKQAPAAWQAPARELAALLAADWRRLEIAH